MHSAGCSKSLSAHKGASCQTTPSDRSCRRSLHAMNFKISAKSDDSDASCINENRCLHCSHRNQHRSRTIKFSLMIMQFFSLLQIAKSCNMPVTGAARNLQRYDFEVDHSCRSTESQNDFPDTSSAAMHLRGGTLSREGFSLTEYSRASAVSFATSARLSGRSTPAARDAAFRPPLHASMPDQVLRQYHESRAAARMQHGRPPKLSRSVEVNH
uniref:Uncharacterized protein n=1 Tax=Cryptomonas curvata TaxID=233186 RepID=A0A7S0LUH4_9CRYP|mmetsp:Transcript_10720/g.22914  ORF Transcript_10720/g.22914 Transcript_10720/m.22914 type:complete len:213 (+) Transcript_10720:35-673(+)